MSLGCDSAFSVAPAAYFQLPDRESAASAGSSPPVSQFPHTPMSLLGTAVQKKKKHKRDLKFILPRPVLNKLEFNPKTATTCAFMFSVQLSETQVSTSKEYSIQAVFALD